MPFIGKQPIVGNFQVCDAISVVNGQAAYTLQVDSTHVEPETANHILVSLNGVLQKPGSSFTISGATLTFASNLATGDVIDFVILLGDVLNIGAPSDDTVATASIQDNAVTAAKLASGVGGKILQVQSTAKTDTFTLSTTDTWTDVTGLSVAITPASTSNKVLINFSIGSSSASSANSRGFKIVRGSTDIAIGDSAGSRVSSTVWLFESAANYSFQSSFTFLDSPSTTSETTYKIQMYANTTSYVNRLSSDSDNDVYGRSASTITAMEVSA